MDLYALGIKYLEKLAFSKCLSVNLYMREYVANFVGVLSHELTDKIYKSLDLFTFCYKLMWFGF